ncbi:flagellar basal-body rod protein FlgF [Magnetovibrio sp.]|uniref:flagellar basal-body rod protein FlgF n=1 Tax=Magnetovibrio sp. TaxID=2024836 RepID=UPI002F92BDCC
METSSYIALSRLGALRREMSTIANNMANMNTTSYKGERMMFVDHITRSKSGDFIADQRLSFTRDVASYRDTSEGTIEQTGNPLDIAIHGDGYFVVQGPNGAQQYTRNGNFRLDNTGQMVTQNGQPVLTDAGAPIFFAPEDTNIVVNGDGTISTENGQIGKLQVVTFDRPLALQRAGNGLYTTDQAAIPIDRPQLAQHALERSNVEGVLEMTRMIEVSRRYKSTQSFIDKEDERIRKAINELAKVGSN